MSDRLIVHTVVTQPFSENTYLVHLEARSDCIVFDPGFEAEKIVRALQQLKLTPAAILNTHGHVDHIAGNAAMKQLWPEAPLVIGRGDAAMLTDPMLNLSGLWGFDIISPEADELVDEGDVYEAAGIALETFDVPGHSPGHVVWLWRGSSFELFGGDVLMQGNVGRTDFPGGSFETLADGIRRKIFTMPDETRVWPGHGPETTVGEEKLNNPFVGAASEGLPPWMV